MIEVEEFKDGYYFAKFIGPIEPVEVRNGKVLRIGSDHLYSQLEFRFLGTIQDIVDQEVTKRCEIKPLIWVEGPSYSGTWVAKTPWNTYVIWEINGNGYWTDAHMPGHFAGEDGINSAKIKVGNHYLDKVISVFNFAVSENYNAES